MSSEELTEALRKVTELGERVQRALAAGNVAEAASLHSELRAVEARRDELFGALTSGGREDRPGRRARSQRREDSALSEERPLREIVLDTLTFLGVPASTSLISDVVGAREGIALPAGRLASLRRDEERSYISASTRTAYVVPALTHDRFSPARGVLASSALPLSRRIVAPASGRVDFLTAVVTLAEAVAARDEGDQQRTALIKLLWKLARSIPDALGIDVDPDQIAKAARAELVIHQASDAAERQEAAERARHQLDAHQQLFGHRTTVITNRRAKEA